MVRRNSAATSLKMIWKNLYSVKCYDKVNMNVFTLSLWGNFWLGLIYFDQFSCKKLAHRMDHSNFCSHRLQPIRVDCVVVVQYYSVVTLHHIAAILIHNRLENSAHTDEMPRRLHFIRVCSVCYLHSYVYSSFKTINFEYFDQRPF